MTRSNFFGHPLDLALTVPALDDDVLALDVSVLLQSTFEASSKCDVVFAVPAQKRPMGAVFGADCASPASRPATTTPAQQEVAAIHAGTLRQPCAALRGGRLE